MPNSTIQLQDCIDYASMYPDIAPVLAPTAAGYSKQVLNIANDVMIMMLQQQFPWKWNRISQNQLAPFPTISYQQDYATVNVSNIAYLEDCVAIDINSTALPLPIFPIEVIRYIQQTSTQYGRAGQICILPNDQLVYGVWTANTVYTNPIGILTTPANTITQIIDTNGNFQVLTVFGTTGGTQPVWPSANAAAGTDTTDGSATWTVANPKGQGFRINPIPPQSGTVYQMVPIAQARPPLFTSFNQTLEPIPDDYANLFRQGFILHCYRHSPDPNTRAKFDREKAAWIEALVMSLKHGDRERDSAGFYPGESIVDGGFGYGNGPNNPYNYGW